MNDDVIREVLYVDLLDEQITDINIANIIKEKGRLQFKEAAPSFEKVVVIPDENYDGLSSVIIDKVSSEVDENIKPENIRLGVSILGVEGNMEADKPDQEKEAIPTKEEQTITPDIGYELARVNIAPIPEEYIIPKLEDKNITENGLYNASDENLDGYSSINVDVKGGSYEDAFIDFKPDSSTSLIGFLKKIPVLDTSSTINASGFFNGGKNLESIPLIDTGNMMYMSSFCAGCEKVEELPLFNTSKNTTFAYFCSGMTSLKEVSLWDTSKSKSMAACFQTCQNLEEIPNFNTSICTDFSSMCRDCSKIKSFPALDTSKGTNMNQLFYNCAALEDIPELDFSSCINLNNAFYRCYGLKNVGGFKDYGKAFLTTAREDYSNYNIPISSSTNLTVESLINILNKVYDIASIGVAKQSIFLGQININKLNEIEEGVAAIQNAISKGWKVV